MALLPRVEGKQGSEGLTCASDLPLLMLSQFFIVYLPALVCEWKQTISAGKAISFRHLHVPAEHWCKRPRYSYASETRYDHQVYTELATAYRHQIQGWIILEKTTVPFIPYSIARSVNSNRPTHKSWPQYIPTPKIEVPLQGLRIKSFIVTIAASSGHPQDETWLHPATTSSSLLLVPALHTGFLSLFVFSHMIELTKCWTLQKGKKLNLHDVAAFGTTKACDSPIPADSGQSRVATVMTPEQKWKFQ
jgi:hypothetical protein